MAQTGGIISGDTFVLNKTHLLRHDLYFYAEFVVIRIGVLPRVTIQAMRARNALLQNEADVHSILKTY